MLNVSSRTWSYPNRHRKIFPSNRAACRSPPRPPPLRDPRSTKKTSRLGSQLFRALLVIRSRVWELTSQSNGTVSNVFGSLILRLFHLSANHPFLSIDYFFAVLVLYSLELKVATKNTQEFNIILGKSRQVAFTASYLQSLNTDIRNRQFQCCHSPLHQKPLR